MRYQLRQFQLDDYETVVRMIHELYKETMSHKVINPIYFYYKEVMEWINRGYHIIVATRDNKVVGFSMSYVNDTRGLTESIYQCEYCYVDKEYRNTRASHLLYNNAFNKGKDLGLMVSVTNSIDNGMSDMVEKHFGHSPKFTIMEG